MNVLRGIVLVCVLTVVPACSVPQDWGDDHLVLDDMQLLGPSDLWTELFSFPAQPATCDFVVCQNVVRGASYEVTGDVEDAKVAALNELLQMWMPMGTTDPFQTDSVDFELREDVDIATTTGTAFMTVRFTEAFDLVKDKTVPHAIVFTVTSDADPNWMSDMVYTRNNLLSPGGLALMAGIFCVVLAVSVKAKRVLVGFVAGEESPTEVGR